MTETSPPPRSNTSFKLPSPGGCNFGRGTCELKMGEATWNARRGIPFGPEAQWIRETTSGHKRAAGMVFNRLYMIGLARKETKNVKRTRRGFDGPEILCRPTVHSRPISPKRTPHPVASQLEKSEYHNLPSYEGRRFRRSSFFQQNKHSSWLSCCS